MRTVLRTLESPGHSEGAQALPETNILPPTPCPGSSFKYGLCREECRIQGLLLGVQGPLPNSDLGTYLLVSFP